jgi:hypothetical protein
LTGGTGSLELVLKKYDMDLWVFIEVNARLKGEIRVKAHKWATAPREVLYISFKQYNLGMARISFAHRGLVS